MDEAVVVFSRKGLFHTKIAARDVRSREHARKLWPMVSSGASRQMVTWVSPSFENGKLRRRSHFRLLPAEHTYNPKAHFDDEEATRHRAAQESPEHRQAQELIATELSRRLDAGLAMPWSFKDADASDYPLEGNLLLGADRVATEHPLETPFGSRFRLDVAVLGPPVQDDPMVLGGVEIELGHAFDGRKALIGKSLGFPLISGPRVRCPNMFGWPGSTARSSTDRTARRPRPVLERLPCEACRRALWLPGSAFRQGRSESGFMHRLAAIHA